MRVRVGDMIPIPSLVIRLCDNFGDQCQKTTEYYHNRWQSNSNKISQDHANGKIGEGVAFAFLKQYFPNISRPDMKIYRSSGKSWQSDLTDPVNNIHFAVKTQEINQAVRFGMSWVFQKTDKEVYGNSCDRLYVCLVTIDRECSYAIVDAVVKCNWLHSHKMFKPLKISCLNSNKQAIYYEDFVIESDMCQL